jgi:hypothetical protein
MGQAAADDFQEALLKYYRTKSHSSDQTRRSQEADRSYADFFVGRVPKINIML